METRMARLRGFFTSEDGLVTVEWVALASAMVVGAIAIGWLVMTNLRSPANLIGSNINSLSTSKPAGWST